MKNIGDLILSKKSSFKIHLTGWEEPNNGRMLWSFNLLEDDEIVDDKYLDSWRFLNFDLEKFEFESKDGTYIYIPTEGNGVLINTKTKKVTKTPYKGLSTHYYIGNYFIDNKLVINYKNEIVVIDLNDGVSMNIQFPEEKMTIMGSEFENDIFLIELFDKNKKEIVQKKYNSIFNEIK